MRRIPHPPRAGLCPLLALVRAQAHLLAVGVLVGGLVTARSASALEPDKALHQFPHRVWETEEGLPQNSTLSLAQTPDGYLWAGTYEGLARFDGVRFTVFDPMNTPALPNRAISALALDRDGTLWINTHQGLAGMRAGSFFSVSLPEAVTAREVHKLLPARDGGIWIATLGSGLVRLSDGRFQIWRIEQGLASDRVLALVEAQDGSLWVATPEGIQRWDGSAFHPGPSFEGPIPRVTSLTVDAQGLLWAGDDGGTVYRQRDGTMHPAPEASLPGGAIFKLLFDRQGTLWVASRGQGLLRLVRGERSVLDTTNGLENGSIFTLFEDAEGSLWMGMGSHGLHRLKDAPFTPYGAPEGLGNNMVSSLREARDGSLWIATMGGGISRWKDGRMTTWTMRDGLRDDKVYGSSEGQDGTLWFLTRRGIIRWHEGTFSHLSDEAMDGSLGYAVHEDAQGTLWVGTQDGLAWWDGQRFKLLSPQHEVLGAFVRLLKRREAGGFWIGTHGGGLAWYSEAQATVLSAPGNPIRGDVRSLHEDGGTLWVGTTDGLFRWKNGNWTRLSRTQGLFDDVILAILPDGRGHLWMTCNKGIFRVSRQELEAVADGLLERVTSYAYGKEEGLRAQEFNSLGGPSGVRTRDGRLWFPTIRGAVAYDPKHELAPAALPPVLIEELWVDGRAVPASEWARLPPSGGRVEIRYTSPALKSPERLRFRFRLEGVDADWVDAGPRRAAYYTRLPPGEHRFLVEAYSTEGGAPAPAASLVFYLQPRYFETLLFRMGGALALALTIAGGVWLRLRRSRERERELQARVDERTTELAARLQQLQTTRERLVHAEKLAAVGTLASGVGHEINNPLAYILSNLRFVSRELRDLSRREEELERWREAEEALTDALHGAERVRTIVQGLKLLARAHAAPPGQVDLHAVLDRALEVAGPDLRLRARLVKDYGSLPLVQGDEGRLGQVFLQLFTNAAQAIPEGVPERNEVRITTRQDEEGRAVIDVRDTGHGITPEVLPRIFEPFFTTREVGEGTGLGLSICHSIIQAMGGEISVESKPGHGSTFRIRLPTLLMAGWEAGSGSAGSRSGS